jgi:hypothetical protein
VAAVHAAAAELGGDGFGRLPRDGEAVGRNHQSFGISGQGSGRFGAAAGLRSRLRLRALQEEEVAGQLPLGEEKMNGKRSLRGGCGAVRTPWRRGR